MDTQPKPRFLHLADIGAMFEDSGKPRPTRQTLIARGLQFATAEGLRVHTVGHSAYVSSADVARVHGGTL